MNVKTGLAGGVFVGVVVLLTIRMVHHIAPPDTQDLAWWGMADFRDAVYYPVAAYLQGDNPYDVEPYLEKYPVGNHFPLYSPLSLLVHLPFGALSFSASRVAYYLLNLVLLFALTCACFRMAGVKPSWATAFLVSAIVLCSQAGRANFNSGQVALPVTLGTVFALHFARTRPTAAGAALALATIKPTFGAPLAVLMFCRGDTKASLIGLTAGGVGAAIGLAPLIAAEGGIGPFVDIAAENQHTLKSDPLVNPLLTCVRIDAAPALIKLLPENVSPPEIGVTLICLLAAGAVLWRLARRQRQYERATPSQILPHCRLSQLVIFLTITVCVYHLIYDALLLIAPLMTLLLAGSTKQCSTVHTLPRFLKRGLCVLMAIPLVNVFYTDTFVWFSEWAPTKLPQAGGALSLVREVSCSANSVCLLLAWLAAVMFAGYTGSKRPFA